MRNTKYFVTKGKNKSIDKAKTASYYDARH
jgi:hypothetical protein